MSLKFYISLVLAIMLLAGTAFAENSAFYVVTNKSDGNSVVGYSQSESGQYQMIGEFKTGGMGTGDLEIPALKKRRNASACEWR